MAENFTIFFLPAVTVVLWLIQRQYERRNRAMEMYRHYESETMKKDRKIAWRYLRGWAGPVVTIGELSQEEDPDRLDCYRACMGILTFFLALHRLVDAGHADRRIVYDLFEEPRTSWAAAFAGIPHTSLSWPTSDGEPPASAVRLDEALQTIRRRFSCRQRLIRRRSTSRESCRPA